MRRVLFVYIAEVHKLLHRRVTGAHPFDILKERMFRVQDVLHVQPDERLCAIVRRHAWTMAPRLAAAGACIALPCLFLFPLLHAGVWGMAALLGAVSAGIVLALQTFFVWDADALLITSERLIDVDQRAVWIRIVSELPLAAVQEVRWERIGAWQTLARTGTLRIRGSQAVSEVVAKDIARPREMHDLIQALRREQAERMAKRSAA